MTHPDILVPSPVDTPARAFFSALYAHAPDDLFLELRAIHPTSHAARSLWGTIGHKSSLTHAFKQAEALNREGYGVYFAPCLRQSKQGKVEATALVPALWVDIDCEDDAEQRPPNQDGLHPTLHATPRGELLIRGIR